MAKKVLIIDDEKDIVKMVTYRIKNAGYEVFAEFDGLKGLERAKEIKPDLIILDLRMPVLDGAEVCKAIRQDPQIKNTPIILLTASHLGDNIEKPFGMEVNDFIVKPYEPEELLAKIKHYVG